MPSPLPATDVGRLTAGVCIIHLIRGSSRDASRKYWDELTGDLWPSCQADTAAAGEQARRSAWTEFVPFLDYHIEIRRVACSANAIESLNARYRRAVRTRGHFPNEQSARKTLYLLTRSLDPKGTGQTGSSQSRDAPIFVKQR